MWRVESDFQERKRSPGRARAISRSASRRWLGNVDLDDRQFSGRRYLARTGDYRAYYPGDDVIGSYRADTGACAEASHGGSCRISPFISSLIDAGGRDTSDIERDTMR